MASYRERYGDGCYGFILIGLHVQANSDPRNRAISSHKDTYQLVARPIARAQTGAAPNSF
jgi:hypothetical protein